MHGLAADPGTLQGLLPREGVWRPNAMAQGQPAVGERPIRRGMTRQESRMQTMAAVAGGHVPTSCTIATV
jgi:hypothetical protein